MSERGSFVTEYIYCPTCLNAAGEVLLDKKKHLCSSLVPSWDNSPERPALPIIAGKLGGLYNGEELYDFEAYYGPELAKRLCHRLRVAVLGEGAQQIYVVEPRGETRDLIEPKSAGAPPYVHSDMCLNAACPYPHGA